MFVGLRVWVKYNLDWIMVFAIVNEKLAMGFWKNLPFEVGMSLFFLSLLYENFYIEAFGVQRGATEQTCFKETWHLSSGLYVSLCHVKQQCFSCSPFVSLGVSRKWDDTAAVHLRSLDPDGLLQGGVGRGRLQDAGGGVQGGGEKTGAVNWVIDTFIKEDSSKTTL